MSLDTNLQSLATAVGTAVKARIPSSEKGQPNGVATLDGGGKIPSAQLPSYVDDVVEYTNLASFPATGNAGILYIDLATNKQYRWGGSTYQQITSGAVDSVNGQTGIVTISTNIAEGTRTSTSVPITSSTGTGATLSVASTSLAGVMSATDKTKLDGIATNANNYSLPTGTSSTLGGIKLGSDTVQTTVANAVTATASKSYSVQVDASGKAVVNIPWTDTTYSNATQSTAGLLSSTDKTVIDNIGATDTNLVSVFAAALA